jgi:hypothetical protein
VRLLALLALSGCQLVLPHEADDIVLAGSYRADITTLTDVCAIDLPANLEVPFEVLQEDTEIAISITGVAMGVLDLVYGNHVLVGSAEGTSISASIETMTATEREGCMIGKARIDLQGALDPGGRVIDGVILHHQELRSGNCAGDCTTEQTFVALRLP